MRPARSWQQDSGEIASVAALPPHVIAIEARSPCHCERSEAISFFQQSNLVPKPPVIASEAKQSRSSREAISFQSPLSLRAKRSNLVLPAKQSRSDAPCHCERSKAISFFPRSNLVPMPHVIASEAKQSRSSREAISFRVPSRGERSDRAASCKEAISSFQGSKLSLRAKRSNLVLPATGMSTTRLLRPAMEEHHVKTGSQ